MGRLAGHLDLGFELFGDGCEGRKSLQLLLQASGADSKNAHEAAAQRVLADCMEAVSACYQQESLVHLLIAAAGSGRRMGADRNKLLLAVHGRPVLAWTLEAATTFINTAVIQIIVNQANGNPPITPLIFVIAMMTWVPVLGWYFWASFRHA